MNKKTVSLLLIFLMVFQIGAISFADNIDNPYGKFVNNGSNPNSSYYPKYQRGSNKYVGDFIPRVTIDDFNAWTNRKGNEIIDFLQRLSYPIVLVMFIFFAIKSLAGIFGNGAAASNGIFGMVMSLVVYALIQYSPLILYLFTDWVMS